MPHSGTGIPQGDDAMIVSSHHGSLFDHVPRFDVEAVLDCGCAIGFNLIEGASGPRVGDFFACFNHSQVVAYDPANGSEVHDRDRRVTEVRRV